MIIGIDFDNTIARYDSSFKEIALIEGLINENWKGKTKTEIRNYLRSLPDGETKWMKLQGLVYGKYMNKAEMMPGVANFLLKCKQNNYKVLIISHKTEYGHFDTERISLRKQALKWMTYKRFFDPDYFALKKENIFFAETRKKKLDLISKSNCEYFIDDLPELFKEKYFPDGPKKILFLRSNTTDLPENTTILKNWEDIYIHIFGFINDKDVKIWAKHLSGKNIISIKKISGKGNSQIFKIKADDKKKYALKYYPNLLIDDRPRLITEYNAFNFLHMFNISNVPESINKDVDLNLGLYVWIEGTKITETTPYRLSQLINFAKQLYIISQNISKQYNTIDLASEACLSRHDIIIQVEKRYNRLKAIENNHNDLTSFLNNCFEPLWQKIKQKSYNIWPEESKFESLPKEKQILSPSDFGLHNTIEKSGNLIFIDFEYFGWDDPVKLTSDVIWHPAMSFTNDQASIWKNSMLKLFSNDLNFKNRLQAALPLFGMRWIMILLNEFLPGLIEKRKKASNVNNYDKNMIRETQLKKAKKYCKILEIDF